MAGTAHLFGLVADDAASRALLQQAWDAGVRRFDTAPSYGGGRTEGELGAFLAGRDGVAVVATKVGLARRWAPAAAGGSWSGSPGRCCPTP